MTTQTVCTNPAPPTRSPPNLHPQEHFGDDERGKRKSDYFWPWHFDFFHRYRHLPEELYEAGSRSHPLIATRMGVVDPRVRGCGQAGVRVCACFSHPSAVVHATLVA